MKGDHFKQVSPETLNVPYWIFSTYFFPDLGLNSNFTPVVYHMTMD